MVRFSTYHASSGECFPEILRYSFMTSPSREQLFAVLEQVKDPEVPAVSIVELGIVREVVVRESPAGTEIQVSITPTYSGCPAMGVIEQEVRTALNAAGYSQVVVQMVFNPPWTTDWITAEGRAKLKEYGIAPPSVVREQPLIQLRKRTEQVPCPFCDATNTKLTSQFSGTACKALYFCDGCHQPFEYFKPF